MASMGDGRSGLNFNPGGLVSIDEEQPENTAMSPVAAKLPKKSQFHELYHYPVNDEAYSEWVGSEKPEEDAYGPVSLPDLLIITNFFVLFDELDEYL